MAAEVKPVIFFPLSLLFFVDCMWGVVGSGNWNLHSPIQKEREHQRWVNRRVVHDLSLSLSITRLRCQYILYTDVMDRMACGSSL